MLISVDAATPRITFSVNVRYMFLQQASQLSTEPVHGNHVWLRLGKDWGYGKKLLETIMLARVKQLKTLG